MYTKLAVSAASHVRQALKSLTKRCRWDDEVVRHGQIQPILHLWWLSTKHLAFLIGTILLLKQLCHWLVLGSRCDLYMPPAQQKSQWTINTKESMRKTKYFVQCLFVYGIVGKKTLEVAILELPEIPVLDRSIGAPVTYCDRLNCVCRWFSSFDSLMHPL